MNFFKRLQDALRGSKTVDLAMAARMWKEGRSIARPGSWHGVLSKEEFLDRFGPYARQSRLVHTRLGLAEKVVLMAATIGIEVEQRAHGYHERGQGILGQALDRMGSLLVEGELRRVHTQLSFQWGQRGYTTIPRFSPGEGDFPSEAQAVFAELAADSGLGLSVTEDRMLLPEKTRTAVMGLYRED
jgi:hypothetical protein